MSNFSFISDDLKTFRGSAQRAEKFVYADPRIACVYARLTLETAVDWVFRAEGIEPPYSGTLHDKMQELDFRRVVGPRVWPKLELIRKLGNRAAHASNKPPTHTDAMGAVSELFHVCFWLQKTYGQVAPSDGLFFDDSLVPIGSSEDKWKGQAAALAAQLEEEQVELAKTSELLSAKETELAAMRSELTAIKKVNSQHAPAHEWNEAETRLRLIDVLLRELGWDPDGDRVKEFEVSGMPTPSGKGYVDYVLWGDDGKPLAVVEAKKTSVEPSKGQHQASLYADCLEKAYGQRPVIFFTNGYEHNVWDDGAGYPPRVVSGFYSKDDLEYAIQKRGSCGNPAGVPVKRHITERYYQMEAIRRVSETYGAKHRAALLVMATGCGKTRTAISIVDVLMRAGCVKRVLFLADRNALVRQAQNAFNTHLPNLPSIDLTRDKATTGSRLVLSTYPTMMNQIDRMADGERIFSPGYFDLIIIDEAHRSVYAKYRAIFRYFDAQLLGLTATPRGEVDWNTYELFGQKMGDPTYYYELDQAVADGYLVPPKGFEIDLNFPSAGIKYDDLTAAEREQYELLFTDPETGEVPDLVEGSALNAWLMNADTVDEVLRHLMEKGLRAEGGDAIGKTIIFARSHKHAEFIQKRFDANFPHLAGRFARVIDNYETYAQDLIDKFAVKSEQPTIAISVDMLDTGIDVPEIVNLVYFKPVRSKVKFQQMLGRGTRLCPDLFGPGEDKAHFYVFDFCGNFAFFRHTPDGNVSAAPRSLSAQIFDARLELSSKLDAGELSGMVREELCGYVVGMNPDNFQVRPHRALVDRFAERQSWEDLKDSERAKLERYVAALPSEHDLGDTEAKRFDLLCLRIQTAIVTQSGNASVLALRMQAYAEALAEKTSIPQVNAKLDMIERLQKPTFWLSATADDIEEVRAGLRDLVKFIDRDAQETIYSNFQDEISYESGEVVVPGLERAESLIAYRRRVEQFVLANIEDPAIKAIHEGKPLSDNEISNLEKLFFSQDGAGDPELFLNAYQERPMVGVFIRALVGLSVSAANEAFADFLADSTYNGEQIRFLKLVLDHICANGVMDPAALYDAPFSDINIEGVDGLFSGKEADRIIALIRELDASALFTAAQLQGKSNPPSWAQH